MGSNEKLVSGKLLNTVPGLKTRDYESFFTNKSAINHCHYKNTNEEITHV